MEDLGTGIRISGCNDCLFHNRRFSAILVAENIWVHECGTRKGMDCGRRKGNKRESDNRSIRNKTGIIRIAGGHSLYEVYQDKIIGRGYNRRMADKTVLAHAEIIAMRKACKKMGDWRLEDCTMYVTLEPCPMCAGAIVQARIPRVVIGCMNPKAGCAGSVLDMLHEEGFNHQVQTDINVCQEECSGMLSRFFKDLRKKRAELKAQKQLQDADPEKAE